MERDSSRARSVALDQPSLRLATSADRSASSRRCFTLFSCREPWSSPSPSSASVSIAAINSAVVGFLRSFFLRVFFCCKIKINIK